MHFQKPILGASLDWGNPLNKGCVMHLAANEGHGDKVQDLSLNGNHGTLNNFAFPPTTTSGWNPGQTGIGLNFDGTNDYIRCDPFVGISSTNSVTMGALVYPTEAGRTQGILNAAAVVTDDTLVLRYGSGNVVQALYWNTFDAAQVVSGVSTIKLNEWQHLMFVLNENNVKIYLNGVLDKEENKIGTLMQDTDQLDIGRYANGSYFNGSIDQVRIMNRAWTAKEVMDYAINPWQVYLDEDDR
jgi:hypothetical protein